MAEPIVSLMKDGAKIYTYELREGIHIEISFTVGLRVDMAKHPDGEASIQDMDKKCAKWTQEYLGAHIEKALRSFDESGGQAPSAEFIDITTEAPDSLSK